MAPENLSGCREVAVVTTETAIDHTAGGIWIRHSCGTYPHDFNLVGVDERGPTLARLLTYIDHRPHTDPTRAVSPTIRPQ